MSGLTTHVLDLTCGRPAAGVALRLLSKAHEIWVQDGAFRTDADGRARLLDVQDVTAGPRRLEFDVGAYFRASGSALSDPGFLETVTIEFNVTDDGVPYHVPLLVSPFGYSTYRGS